MQIITAVSLATRDGRRELGPVIGAAVEDAEAEVLEVDERSHHEGHRLQLGPRALVLWPVVDVHLWRVQLQRQLAHAAHQTGGDHVVEHRPLGELYVHLQVVDRSLEKC